jgi:pilus assembly protein CpaF
MDFGGHTGAESHPLRKASIRIGRDPKVNDIVIPKDTVSSKQAVVEFREGVFYVRDLRSSNGTFLNGRRFSDPETIREAVLKHGDRLRFDAFEFEFREDALEGKRAAYDGVAAGGGASPGGTLLRAEAPPASPARLQSVDSRMVPSGSDGRERSIAKEPGTLVKPDMCPNHPAWKATELCSICRVPKCKTCVTETNGRTVCAQCAG